MPFPTTSLLKRALQLEVSVKADKELLVAALPHFDSSKLLLGSILSSQRTQILRRGFIVELR